MFVIKAHTLNIIIVKKQCSIDTLKLAVKSGNALTKRITSPEKNTSNRFDAGPASETRRISDLGFFNFR
ncbi:hypothetical protein AGMMS50222_03540 [Endomicrobiia bacterium]|nr:hypothetical protein AGMMS49531_02690 [Endomicrobiia bacterium]GHT64817.1 hypothetical protein AGMMS49556_03540 [Endomicrobiia bacterium]GHT74420.1 hypothetical protein AGMMS50222_03540 [Endomicrobiia bacterium]